MFKWVAYWKTLKRNLISLNDPQRTVGSEKLKNREFNDLNRHFRQRND